MQVSGSTVAPGSTITYTLTAVHETGVAVTGATAVDDLSAVLPYASVVLPLPPGLTLDGSTLTWALPDLPVGGSVRVSFEVTVRGDAAGVTIVNLATPTSEGGNCSPCRTEHPVPAVVPPPVTPPPAEPPPAGPLPYTGAALVEGLWWAAGMLGVGALLLAVSRRRRPLGRRPAAR